jgi:glycine cleavage system H protein
MIKYTKDHEWISGPDEVGHYKIGISEFAVKELGDIVYLDMEYDIADDVAQDEVFGSIEAVKTVSDLFMPVTGYIADFNEELLASPELLNCDTALEQWILKVKIEDASVLESLISEEDYLKEYSK